jgi:xanthine dehydrogenase YagR molybdenum-binding subunit
MTAAVGQPHERVDGPAKVTGQAAYVGDLSPPDMVHAAIAQSAIAKGRIAAIDTAAATVVPGVLLVLTKDNAPRLAPCPLLLEEKSRLHSAGQSYLPLQDDRIHYAGQPVALVVAETSEAAAAAAELVAVRYETENPAVDLADPQVPDFAPIDVWTDPQEGGRGDLALGLAEAKIAVDATYVTALQVHTAMEPHATVAVWSGDQVTVHEPTTWVWGMKRSVAAWFGLPEENVRVVQRFVGGSFGCKGPAWPHVALTVLAARLVHRPVRLVLTRRDTFTMVGHRPRIEHRIQLAATRAGRLTALAHFALTHSSAFDGRVVAPATKTSRKLYACPHVLTTYRMKHLNLPAPFTMRGPGETPGLFALESAMDELAYALDMDPVELRLKNEAVIDLDGARRWSSRSLPECFRQAGQRFGWSARDPRPRSMTKDGKLVGWGTASMAYDAHMAPTAARARLYADGSVLVQSATCDQGTGSYTVFPQVAAEVLDLPAARVRFELGDSDFPMAPISAGSMTMASVGSAVQAAAVALRRKLIGMAVADPASALYGEPVDAVLCTDGLLISKTDPQRRDRLVDPLHRRSLASVEAEGQSAPGGEQEEFTRYSFGAHFTEVLVDPDTLGLRVSRHVAAFGAGRIINPRLAHSQLVGGIVWGIGMALHEEARVDHRLGRIMNARMADYLVPVMADIPAIDAFFVDEQDDIVNPLGAKGLGEIGTIGTAAAIANAMYHATGKRLRELPLTVEKLLG